MARLQRRTLTAFLEQLPAEVDRLAIHVGDQRAPQHRGDLDLGDCRDDDGKVMVARVEDVVAQRVASYGYPEEHPSFQLLAYAAKKKVDSYQDTASAPTAGDKPGMGLEAVVVRMADTLRLSLADANSVIKEGWTTVGQLTTQISDLRAEVSDRDAALALKDEAIKAAEEGATLALQMRTVDALENGVTAWAQGKGGISPQSIINLCKKAPDKAKKLVRALMEDETVKAIIIEAMAG